MNLHQVVRGAINAVNPDITGSVKASTGYITGADGAQVPSYGAPYTAALQVQPLSGKDLKQLDALNVQGTDRAVFINGALSGENRADAKGGDLITFADGRVWLVTALLEPWDSAGWCKVGVAQQVAPPA